MSCLEGSLPCNRGAGALSQPRLVQTACSGPALELEPRTTSPLAFRAGALAAVGWTSSWAAGRVPLGASCLQQPSAQKSARGFSAWSRRQERRPEVGGLREGEAASRLCLLGDLDFCASSKPCASPVARQGIVLVRLGSRKGLWYGRRGASAHGHGASPPWAALHCRGRRLPAIAAHSAVKAAPPALPRRPLFRLVAPPASHHPLAREPFFCS